MRITMTTNDTAMVFMRRSGYGYQKEEGSELAFVRRVGGGLFPRYHAYVIESHRQVLEVNLHIDQKEPTYGGSRAHAGEYDGPLIEQEAARLRELAQASAGPSDRTAAEHDERKGFWGRLFS